MGQQSFQLVYVFIYLVLRHVDVYFQARFKRSLLGDIDRPTFFFKIAFDNIAFDGRT